MNSDEKPSWFPLPPGIKRRSLRFGPNPASPLTTVRANRESVDARPSPELFKIRWEDAAEGLKAIVREQADGRLRTDVSSMDDGLLNKGALSVALVGIMNDSMIHKTIHFKVPENNGCSGSADFGPLADAVTQLGSQLRIIVILAVERPEKPKDVSK